jgi:hypothetical protein
VPRDPYLRFDTCAYSLDPRLVGRRVEARITEREVLAVALETGELGCRHPRSFARHRTITARDTAAPPPRIAPPSPRPAEPPSAAASSGETPGPGDSEACTVIVDDFTHAPFHFAQRRLGGSTHGGDS